MCVTFSKYEIDPSNLQREPIKLLKLKACGKSSNVYSSTSQEPCRWAVPQFGEKNKILWQVLWLNNSKQKSIDDEIKKEEDIKVFQKYIMIS